MSWARVGAVLVVCLAGAACAQVSGLSGYAACSGECGDASLGGMRSDGSVDRSDVAATATGDANDDGSSEGSPTGDDGADDVDAPATPVDCGAGPCLIVSGAVLQCSAGGCNSAGGACPSTSACYCTADSQCTTGKCVRVVGQNDVSCPSGCTGAGAHDGFDCQLGGSGIPSACKASFGYSPSNFAPASYTPPPSATTINCSTTYSSSSHAFTGWCAGQTMPTIASNVTQSGGPKIDVLAFAGLTLTSGSTLTLTGSNAVILAVYGDATIAGAIHADGAAGASSSNTPGASGPGGNYSCGASAGTSQPSDGHCSGGAGGGAGAAGGAGASGVGGSTAAAGALRANATLSPLYGGCPGGTSGSWACQTSGGGGGGAVEIAAAGALTVSGTLTASGGAGGTSMCFAGGCGANGYGGGGGGAGSGGAILLQGQSVSTAGATVTPNGGSGGSPNTMGGGGTATGGQGGAGGTSASTTGGDGTGSTSNGCGPYTDCGGGGGGGYGYGVTAGNQQAPSYACPTALTPAPACNAAHTACVCVADGDCQTAKCVNQGQCTGTCSGAGSADTASCQIQTPVPVGYSCAKGSCSDVTSAGATCTTAGTPCWCARDADCTGGSCVTWAGCATGACTGTGTPDAFHCAP